MLGLIRKWWHARQRNIDLQILWPACKQQATDLIHARAAFAEHAYNDAAWLELGYELDSTIDELE